MISRKQTRIFYLIIAFIFKLNVLKCKGNTDPHEEQLVNDLTTNYNILVRATQNYSEKTDVEISLYLSQILEVAWNDPRLQWDENAYNNINEIHITTDKIWKPDIRLYNTVEASIFSSDVTEAVIYSNGDVYWWIESILKSSCVIDIRYFPFDTQNCTLTFASWTYDASKIDAIAGTANLEIYKNNTEFNLKNFTIQRRLRYYADCTNMYDDCGTPYSEIDFNIIIERRPFFYVFNMIIPCVVITLVAFIGFCMPASSGEKISIGITTLLSISVLLLVISADLPISDSVSLLGAFYCASMVIVSLVTGATVFTLNIHHKSEDDQPVPRFLQKIFFSKVGKVIMFPCPISTLNEETDILKMDTKTRTTEMSIVSDQKSLLVENLIDEVSTSSQVIKRNKNPSQLFFRKNSSISPCNNDQLNKTRADSKPSIQTSEEQKELARKQWSLLSSIFDRLFFYLFAIITTVVLISIIFQVPNI